MRARAPSFVLVLVAALASLCAARKAAAQSVRPNILIIFDTSFSMLARAKDGSQLCGYDGIDSRIYSLKEALREALVQVGTDEANFGLERFPQLENPAVLPACPVGHYTAEGCGLSSHTDQTTYGDWFRDHYREAVVVDVTRPPNPGPLPGPMDFDPPDGNLKSVYQWIDGLEDMDMVPPIEDPELRAGGGEWTPLGRSLFYARLYFDNFVKRNDPRDACRTNTVILITDGEENCDSTEGTLDLTDCSGTASEFSPPKAACRLFRELGIKTYVVVQGDFGPESDPVAQAGGTGSAKRVSLTDTGSVQAALTEIIANAVPAVEVCNGKDDNCNGQIDEGVSNGCAWAVVDGKPNDCLDPPACTKFKHCAVEECNCIDDNCDGVTDEGFKLGACGQPCGCPVPQEICDGIDNNCNGQTDEGFPNLGATCDNKLLGNCLRQGVVECSADGSKTECSAPDISPSPEICNGQDDNCNGQTDERENGQPLPGEGLPCGVAVGECQPGTTVCSAGQLVCMGGGMSMPEVCDGLDNNCNGIVDDPPPGGMLPGEGEACLCPGLDEQHANKGECHPGATVCKGGHLVCEGCAFPSPELCDGKDNDCDGVVDGPGAGSCPPMFECHEGQCALACRTGEFPCSPGCACHDGFCICDKCAGVTCPAGFGCQPADGTCKDLCKDVRCSAPQTCKDGRCVDCYTTGCPAGASCLAGVCQPCENGVCDPCRGVVCTSDQFCAEGICKPLCSDAMCPPGQSCAGGTCRPDPCKGVACHTDQFCDPATGTCQQNPCLIEPCSPGMRCIPATGECRPDPCARLGCGDDICRICNITPDGVAGCVINKELEICRPTVTVLKPGGGGGCSCDAGAAGAGRSLPALLFAFLAALGAGLRRRGNLPRSVARAFARRNRARAPRSRI